MTRGASARLFVAADLPDEVRERLSSWARGALGAIAPGGGRGAARALEPEALHLTLCFLGSRPVGEIAALDAALARCAHSVGELCTGAPLWLPPRRPHALAVEVADPAGALARLQAEILEALAQASAWEPERRRFRAHVTVLRLRGSGRLSGRAGTLPPSPRIPFTPEWVTLYRSQPTPAGSVYEALARWALAPD